MGMIDEQYKAFVLKDYERLKEDLKTYQEVNVSLRKEIRMLEKLIELNMKDFWDVCDQRDWYYEEYQKLKEKNKNNQIKNTTLHK